MYKQLKIHQMQAMGEDTIEGSSGGGRAGEMEGTIEGKVWVPGHIAYSKL